MIASISWLQSALNFFCLLRLPYKIYYNLSIWGCSWSDTAVTLNFHFIHSKWCVCQLVFCVVLFQALEKHKIKLVWDHSILAVLADGYNVHYGARSIKYEVERQVVNRLAAAHERGIIGNGSTVRLSELPTAETRIGAAIKLQVKLKDGMEYVDIEEEKDLKYPLS